MSNESIGSEGPRGSENAASKRPATQPTRLDGNVESETGALKSEKLSPEVDGSLGISVVDEYPSGLKMFFIVVALALSIFLVAIDLV